MRDSSSEGRMVVDRFEADLVVIETEDGQIWELPRWLLPPVLHEGDVVIASPTLEREAAVVLQVDHAETRRRRDQAERIISRLHDKDPGGDIAL